MPSQPRKDADGHFKNHNLPTVCPWASQDSAGTSSNNILVIISITRCQITVNTNIIIITITQPTDLITKISTTWDAI